MISIASDSSRVPLQLASPYTISFDAPAAAVTATAAELRIQADMIPASKLFFFISIILLNSVVTIINR